MTLKKIIATAVLVLCSIGSVYLGRVYFGPHGRMTLDPRIAHRSKGDPKASVWVVEYLDYQCPSCRTATRMLEAYFQQYPANLYLQVRFHPLKQHPHGLESALYAECATRQNKFWKFHHLLFEQQDSLKDESDATDKFRRMAEEAGLDLKKLNACVTDPLTKETVLKENAESQALGVTSTPSFFISGKMAVGVNALLDELQAISPGFEYDLTEGSHAK